MNFTFKGRPLTKERLGWWFRIALTRLFGRLVYVEGRRQPLRILPYVHKGRLLLMGAEHEFLQIYFTNQYTAALRSAPRCEPPKREASAAVRPIRRVVHVILCHQPADVTMSIYRYHQERADYRILIAYGGSSQEFDKLTADKYFVDDLSLRGPSYLMSHHEMVRKALDIVGDDTSDVLYVFTESDFVPLASNYLAPAVNTLVRFDCDFCCKDLRDITFSSNGFLARAVQQAKAGPTASDPEIADRRYYHCLGCFFGLRGSHAKKFVSDCERMQGLYFEVMFPTAASAVGAKLLSLDTCSSFLNHVRYQPEYSVEELESAAAVGAKVVHPVKGDVLQRFLSQPRFPQKEKAGQKAGF